MNDNVHIGMFSHDREKIVALLKSVVAPCEVNAKSGNHVWGECRHCLAILEFDDGEDSEDSEDSEVRAMLRALIKELQL